MARVNPEEIRARFWQLKDQRTSWEPLWKDIRDYILPDYGVFDGDDPADGGKRYRRIQDAEATNCADMLAAGLLSGVSSPSRPWLRLTTFDEELDAYPSVKEWLAATQRKMLMTFAKADVYNQLHQSYIEIPTFGQAALITQPHPNNIINVSNITIGQYWFSEDPYGAVDTMYRRIEMTAKQMVQQFGWDAVSTTVRSMYEKAPFTRFRVIHAIEPRFERDVNRRDAINKPWLSVYFEEDDPASILSESGFDTFPAMCPRWMTCGGSQYGRGPGAKALSAAKTLQRLQVRLATMTDYMSDPPRTYPDDYVGNLGAFRPGGMIPVKPNQEALIRSAWEPPRQGPDMLQLLINDRRQQIQRLYYVNVFQMIQSTALNPGDRTATEVAALEQEKSMMMGPVLERLHSELLDPLTSNTFAYMVQQDQIPPPPPELQGKQLNVEYISVLAEQQKNSQVNGILRFTQQIGMLSQINANSLDKLDVDAAIDVLADMNGVPPSMVVSGDRLALIRQQRAEQMQQAQQAEQASQLSQNLRNLTPAMESQAMRDAMQGG